VVHLPYLAGTADERQFQVMSHREQWFRIVMGHQDALRAVRRRIHSASEHFRFGRHAGVDSPTDQFGCVRRRQVELGRCGLIIATATGVHPGFFGCLTLELSNVGEIPIAVKPGYPIGQLFFHTVEQPDGEGAKPTVSRSTFGGSRRPLFKTIKLDPFAERLAKADKR
jgi:dUTPase